MRYELDWFYDAVATGGADKSWSFVIFVVSCVNALTGPPSLDLILCMPFFFQLLQSYMKRFREKFGINLPKDIQ